MPWIVRWSTRKTADRMSINSGRNLPKQSSKYIHVCLYPIDSKQITRHLDHTSDSTYHFTLCDLYLKLDLSSEAWLISSHVMHSAKLSNCCLATKQLRCISPMPWSTRKPSPAWSGLAQARPLRDRWNLEKLHAWRRNKYGRKTRRRCNRRQEPCVCSRKIHTLASHRNALRHEQTECSRWRE